MNRAPRSHCKFEASPQKKLETVQRTKIIARRKIGLRQQDFFREKSETKAMAMTNTSLIIEMERRIAVLISNKLSEVTTGWEKQRIPQGIYMSAKKRMEQDGTRFDENLDLGDELQIITQKNNWDEVFFDIFIKKERFINHDELKLAFSYLSKVRNPASHGKSVVVVKEDLDQCSIYLQKLSKIVPEIVNEYNQPTDPVGIQD